jgi:hypothetical protein
MALAGFAVILALLSIPSQESRHDEHESEPAVAD